MTAGDDVEKRQCATSPEHGLTADEGGLEELGLVVNDGQSNSEVATVSVTATKQNSAPVANAGPDLAIPTGSVVNLDGRQSSDADGDPITYQWSFSSKQCAPPRSTFYRLAHRLPLQIW